MKKFYVFQLLTIALSLQQQTFAQDSTDQKSDAKKSYFQGGLSYLNNNVYLGRKDSVKIPYITPSIGYYHKSGLFINANASYLSTESRIDLVTFEGGYSFSAHKLDGELSAEKYFYSSQSYSVRSEIKGSTSAYIGYDLGFIKPSVTGSIIFGNVADYALSFGLEHTFLTADDKVDITPSVFMNAGTQNFYNAYYQKRRYVKKRKGKKTVYNITANTADASRFKIADYELIIPVNYVYKKFTFNITPTYAVPVNANIVTLTYKPANGVGASITKTNTESISNTLFWSLGVAYKF